MRLCRRWECDVLVVMKVWLLLVWVLWDPGAARAGKWTTYEKCTLVDDAYHDGDSFHVKAPTGYTYVFRLYGVDCPETDDRFPDRLEEQSKDFGVPVADLRKWGKKAERFTRTFLRRPFTVHTRKEKARGAGRKNRYYALVVNARGERLDEALVAAGLARVFGVGAEWPERMTRERFLRKLHALESAAKRDRSGVWEE